MKRILKTLIITCSVFLISSTANVSKAQYGNDYNDDSYNNSYDNEYDNGYNNRDISYQTFYDELSPYGQWVNYPGHGFVWVPDVQDDFQPYSTNGHWVWTNDYEWMWVSDYNWGWAPFHYGRWDYDNYYGWYWVPGYEWSPAWVAWRDGGDYYGWAPIRPGINISVNFNIGSYAPPYNFWCFAPRRYITSPRISLYYVNRSLNINIIHQTRIIVNNYRYNRHYGLFSGPRRYDAERYCGRINPIRIQRSYRPGRSVFNRNVVSVYRPNVSRVNNRNIAPRHYQNFERRSGSFRSNRTTNNARVRNNRAINNNRNVFERRNNNLPQRRVMRQPDSRSINSTPDRNNRRMERRNDNTNRRPDRRNQIRPEQRRNNDNVRTQRNTTTNNRNQSDIFQRRSNPSTRQPSQNNRQRNVQRTPNRTFERRQAPQRNKPVRAQQNENRKPSTMKRSPSKREAKRRF